MTFTPYSLPNCKGVVGEKVTATLRVVPYEREDTCLSGLRMFGQREVLPLTKGVIEFGPERSCDFNLEAILQGCPYNGVRHVKMKIRPKIGAKAVFTGKKYRKAPYLLYDDKNMTTYTKTGKFVVSGISDGGYP